MPHVSQGMTPMNMLMLAEASLLKRFCPLYAHRVLLLTRFRARFLFRGTRTRGKRGTRARLPARRVTASLQQLLRLCHHEYRCKHQAYPSTRSAHRRKCETRTCPALCPSCSVSPSHVQVQCGKCQYCELSLTCASHSTCWKCLAHAQAAPFLISFQQIDSRRDCATDSSIFLFSLL